MRRWYMSQFNCLSVKDFGDCKGGRSQSLTYHNQKFLKIEVVEWLKCTLQVASFLKWRHLEQRGHLKWEPRPHENYETIWLRFHSKDRILLDLNNLFFQGRLWHNNQIFHIVTNDSWAPGFSLELHITFKKEVLGIHYTVCSSFTNFY